MRKQKITLEVPVEKLGLGSLIDQLYKKVSRPKILQPTFVIGHPMDLSPLARRNDADPRICDRFQLVVAGWEIVNAYSELVDPAEQARRFEEQAALAAKGDTEAHRKDEEYVQALEYGCPPCSGFGMGIDRIVALRTQQSNLREVVLFPLLKPVGKNATKNELTNKRINEMAVPSGTPMAEQGTPTTLLQHTEYGHLLPAAHGLLAKHADKTRAHLIATGAAMEALAPGCSTTSTGTGSKKTRKSTAGRRWRNCSPK